MVTPRSCTFICYRYMLMLYINGMRVLLTEGAGLTSRQVATQLDRQGHDVSAIVCDPFCLDRFTRHVGKLHRGPSFGADPLAWFDQMLVVARRAQIDVVFPTQEQVAVLSHQLPRLTEAGLATAVPPFTSLLRVQDKISAWRTLEELDVPQPHSMVVQTSADASVWSTFPAYVKAPVATSSIGVRRVGDHTALHEAVEYFVGAGATAHGGVLVQHALEGMFVMAQCVFDRGSLMAFHANQRVREGANGSASAKTSLHQPSLRGDLARLGRALDWHGALSVDAIVAGERAYVIDVNPRLVEPGNALASGTDMTGALLAVATGQGVAAPAVKLADVRTHQLLMAVLGTAQRTGRRRSVVAEIARAATHRGVYRHSREELLPLHQDWRAIAPMAAAALATLARPQLYRVFTEGAVSHYALRPAGWQQLRGAPAPSAATPERA
jgi:glutathione synthase/RimK-type ligase-like ATP-grasp enzyme